MGKDGFGYGHAEIVSFSEPLVGVAGTGAKGERSELEVDLIYNNGVVTDAMRLEEVSQRRV